MALSVLLLSLLSFILSTLIVHGQTCGWGGFDLSSMQGQFATLPQGPNESVYMSVCAPLPKDRSCGTAAVASTSACFSLSAGDTTYYDLGEWSAPSWSEITTGGEGIQYAIQGAENCDDGAGGTTTYSTVVQFLCASEVSATTAIINSNCEVTFIWPTPLTCSSSGPPCTENCGDGGMNGGAVAGIIISILVVIGACAVALWYMNKTGRLERVKATLNGSGKQQPLLASAADI